MSATVLTPHRSSLLRNALLANAAFSAVSGLSFIVFARPVGQFLGWSAPWILPFIGLGLLGFALWVFQSAKAPQVDTANAKRIIAADLVWVVLSLVMIVAPSLLTLGGKWAVGILADAVATFALLQYLGLRRVRS